MNQNYEFNRDASPRLLFLLPIVLVPLISSQATQAGSAAISTEQI